MNAMTMNRGGGEAPPPIPPRFARSATRVRPTSRQESFQQPLHLGAVPLASTDGHAGDFAPPPHHERRRQTVDAPRAAGLRIRNAEDGKRDPADSDHQVD